LAQEIVTRYHSKADADQVLADFEARSKEGAVPENIPETVIHTSGAGIGIGALTKQVGLAASTGEANRLIDGNGLKIDGENVREKGLVCAAGTKFVLQAGKRKFVRVSIV
jgi:tyrosyl-tRNA synthetase